VATGTDLEMTAKLPIIEAKLVKCPVLLARGQHDGIATEADILDFYRQLPNPDRQLAILPGLAHSLTLGYNRQSYWHVANAFLSMPKPQVMIYSTNTTALKIGLVQADGADFAFTPSRFPRHRC